MKSLKSGGGIIKCSEAAILGGEGYFNRREELKGLKSLPASASWFWFWSPLWAQSVQGLDMSRLSHITLFSFINIEEKLSVLVNIKWADCEKAFKTYVTQGNMYPCEIRTNHPSPLPLQLWGTRGLFSPPWTLHKDHIHRIIADLIFFNLWNPFIHRMDAHS